MRMFVFCLAVALTTSAAWAHFFFIDVSEDRRSAVVVFGEDTIPDLDVPAEKVTLQARDGSGRDTKLKHTPGDKVLDVNLPTGTQLVYGHVAYGVVQRGDSDPFMLHYYPKADLGKVDDEAALGESAPVELVAEKTDAGVRFRFLAKGKPLAETSVTVIEPSGSEDAYTTDAAGYTQAFKQTGHYNVWAGHSVEQSGQFKGKAYKQVKHYATLVVDVE